MEDFLNAKMLAAFFADRRKGGARFRLLMAAMRAGHQDLVLLASLAFNARAAPEQRRLNAPIGFGRLGDLRRFAGSRLRRVGETLFGLTSVLPTKVTPSSIDQFGGANVAEQFRLGFDLDLVLGDDVAVDLAAHDHRLGVDVAVDDRAVAEVQRAVGLDFAIQFAVEGQFAGELQVAFDLDIRGQHVF